LALNAAIASSENRIRFSNEPPYSSVRRFVIGERKENGR
jgi:hypothetical protein